MTMKNPKDPSQSDRYAAALQYNPGQDGAPRVTAAGRGDMARLMGDMARENKIPVYEDPELAKTLYRLGVSTEIPPELYEVVAQILIYVARIDKKLT